jgi:hypothetical protein
MEKCLDICDVMRGGGMVHSSGGVDDDVDTDNDDVVGSAAGVDDCRVDDGGRIDYTGRIGEIGWVGDSRRPDRWLWSRHRRGLTGGVSSAR